MGLGRPHPSTIKGSWLSRILAMLAVLLLFLSVPVAYAATEAAPSRDEAASGTAVEGRPDIGRSPRLLHAHASALAAYRGALHAANRARIVVHGRPGAIMRSSSIVGLNRIRAGWLRREHRYRRIGRVVRAALRQRGTRYVWGGASPSGFDCSGLVMWAYGRAGMRLPHSTYSLVRIGRRVRLGAMLPGDLVFMDGDGHVGIYVGHGAVVHAPHSGDVVRLARVSGWRLTAIRRII
jgi:hypothetical protein